MSGIHSKITMHAKKQENTTHNENNQSRTDINDKINRKSNKTVTITLLHIFKKLSRVMEESNK